MTEKILKKQFHSTFYLLAVFFLANQSGYGQEIPSTETITGQSEMLLESLEAADGSLQLTDEQDQQVRTIIKDNREAMIVVIKQHDIKAGDELSVRQKLSLARDMRPIRKETDKKLAAVLSPDQMAKLEKIRDDIRDEIRAQRNAGNN